MRRKRRNHSPEFKSKVALEALKGDLSMVEMVKKFDVHSNQITEWKKQLLNGAVDVFGKGARKAEESEETVQSLHAKIGQLTMENDFSYGLFQQAGQIYASLDAIALSRAYTGSFGTAADRPTVDDGSSSYPRIGYRISYFRRGAASLLDRGSTYRCCPQKNLEDSPHRACRRSTKRTRSGHRYLLSRFHLATDIPNESGQFPGNRGADFVLVQPLGTQPAEAMTKPQLRFPGEVDNGLRLTLKPRLQRFADPWRKAIVPSRLNEDASCMGVAGLGQAAAALGVAARILGRYQTEVAHELAGMRKPPQVAEFRDQRHGREETDAAQSHEGLDHGQPAPGGCLLAQRLFNTHYPLGGDPNRETVFGEHDMMGRVRKCNLRQEEFMSWSPTPSGIGVPLAEQERSQPLAGSTLFIHHVGARADQVADGLILRLWDRYGCELSSPMQAGQEQRITPIGLDPIRRMPGYARRRDDVTGVPTLAQAAHKSITAGPRLVAEV
jgi:transposase